LELQILACSWDHLYLSSLSSKSRLPSPNNIFFKENMATKKHYLLSFREEHWIFLTKILPSWHHPQKIGAWNANKKHD